MSVCAHTERSTLKLLKSNQILIVITIFDSFGTKRRSVLKMCNFRLHRNVHVIIIILKNIENTLISPHLKLKLSGIEVQVLKFNFKRIICIITALKLLKYISYNYEKFYGVKFHFILLIY